MMEVTYKDLLKELPGSWSEFKLKDFMKTLDVAITDQDLETSSLFVGLDNSLKVISALCNVNVEDLESLPLWQIAELTNKLAFMADLPKEGETSIKWKTMNEMSFNDFVTYKNAESKPLHSLPLIIQACSEAKLTEEQVQNLSMAEVHSGFFTLNKMLKRYARRSIISSSLLLMIQVTKLKAQKLLSRMKGKNR